MLKRSKRDMDPVSSRLILASQSPRRAALLSQMGFRFDVMPPHILEEQAAALDPVAFVLELSGRKAESVLDQAGDGLVVGADTVVHLEDVLLGKPRNDQEAKNMLTRLSGKTHQVYTGFTLVDASTRKTVSDVERTDVTFRRLDEWEIDAYVASKNPLDKAGAYGIQDQSGFFVERIDGCFYNVVGFPLTKFYEALKTLWTSDMLHSILANGPRQNITAGRTSRPVDEK
jgi:septum formation protein